MLISATPRQTMRDRITSHFENNIHNRYPSNDLHIKFGTSFRTRVSEVNRDPVSTITIHNSVRRVKGREVSEYWATVRSEAAANAA